MACLLERPWVLKAFFLVVYSHSGATMELQYREKGTFSMNALLTTQEIPEIHPNLFPSDTYKGCEGLNESSFIPHLGQFIITMENSTLKPIFLFPTGYSHTQVVSTSA